jgi:uncharacterized repeat protein (TIGR01451 family)
VVQELNAAGWILAVAYHDANEPGRNLSLFLGADWVDEDTTLDTVATGFCAPPSGDVRGKILVAAIEGDAHFSGDRLLLGDGDDFEGVAGPFNPAANFFGSQINDSAGERDTRGTFGDRNQDVISGANMAGGRQGWDITAAQVSSDAGHLSNGQTSATVRAQTTGDSFVVSMVAFQLDVNSPGFDTTTATEVFPEVVGLGDTVVVTTLVENLGTANADEVVFMVDLPDELSLADGSIVVNGGVVDTDRVRLLDGISLGGIETGERINVSMTLNVDSLVPGTPIAVAPIWSYRWRTCPTAPPVSALAYATPGVLQTGSIQVDGSATPNAGELVGPYDLVTYHFTIDNSGTTPTEMLVASGATPDGLLYVPGSTFIDDDTVDDATGYPLRMGVELGSLPAGESVVVETSFTVAPDASAEVALETNVAGVELEITHGVDDDVDGDGWSNTREDLDGDGELDDDDTDGDGDPNFADPDDDGDGIATRDDNCPLTPNSDQTDSDDDGVGDACAGDRDGDGVPDEDDNCPDTPNPDQTDTDDDGDGDACDTDDDGDGVSDGDDNCPVDANPDQADMDEDGEGDACDGDIDGDRLDNDDEDGRGTDPEDPDTDEGGVEDGDEVDRGTDPLDPSDDFPSDADTGVDVGFPAVDTGADGNATSAVGCCATSKEPQRALPAFMAALALIGFRRRRR